MWQFHEITLTLVQILLQCYFWGSIPINALIWSMPSFHLLQVSRLTRFLLTKKLLTNSLVWLAMQQINHTIRKWNCRKPTLLLKIRLLEIQTSSKILWKRFQILNYCLFNIAKNIKKYHYKYELIYIYIHTHMHIHLDVYTPRNIYKHKHIYNI